MEDFLLQEALENSGVQTFVFSGHEVSAPHHPRFVYEYPERVSQGYPRSAHFHVTKEARIDAPTHESMTVSVWLSPRSDFRPEYVTALSALVSIGAKLGDPFLDSGSGELQINQQAAQLLGLL